MRAALVLAALYAALSAWGSPLAAQQRAVRAAIEGTVYDAAPLGAQRTAVRTAIEGTVYDTVSGRPIPFAVVSVAQVERSTLTDSKGRYRLPIEAGTWDVQVRKIGYRMRSVSVAVSMEDTTPAVRTRHDQCDGRSG
jgi:hypothetical protein